MKLGVERLPKGKISIKTLSSQGTQRTDRTQHCLKDHWERLKILLTSAAMSPLFTTEWIKTPTKHPKMNQLHMELPGLSSVRGFPAFRSLAHSYQPSCLDSLEGTLTQHAVQSIAQALAADPKGTSLRKKRLSLCMKKEQIDNTWELWVLKLVIQELGFFRNCAWSLKGQKRAACWGQGRGWSEVWRADTECRPWLVLDALSVERTFFHYLVGLDPNISYHVPRLPSSFPLFYYQCIKNGGRAISLLLIWKLWDINFMSENKRKREGQSSKQGLREKEPEAETVTVT